MTAQWSQHPQGALGITVSAVDSARAAVLGGSTSYLPRRTIGFIVAAGDKSPRTFGAAWRSFPQIRRDDLPSGPILPRIHDIEPRCRFPRGPPPYRAEP